MIDPTAAVILNFRSENLGKVKNEHLLENVWHIQYKKDFGGATLIRKGQEDKSIIFKGGLLEQQGF